MENLNKSEVITKLYTFEELIISMNIYVTLHIIGVEEERYRKLCQTIEQAWFSYLVLIKILHDGYFYSLCRCREEKLYQRSHNCMEKSGWDISCQTSFIQFSTCLGNNTAGFLSLRFQITTLSSQADEYHLLNLYLWEWFLSQYPCLLTLFWLLYLNIINRGSFKQQKCIAYSSGSERLRSRCQHSQIRAVCWAEDFYPLMAEEARELLRPLS